MPYIRYLTACSFLLRHVKINSADSISSDNLNKLFNPYVSLIILDLNFKDISFYCVCLVIKVDYSTTHK